MVMLTENEIKALEFVRTEEERVAKIKALRGALQDIVKELKKLDARLVHIPSGGAYERELTILSKEEKEEKEKRYYPDGEDIWVSYTVHHFDI